MLRATMGSLGIVIAVIALMAVVQIINDHTGDQLRQFGVFPRTTGNWMNIVWAPFIHGSYGHLASNGVGMLVFGGLTVLRSRRLFLCGSAAIIIVSGVIVWMLGRPALHFGASGWVYGLWALTISIAWFDRKVVNILVALLVLLFYGGMSYGLLPMKASVSFEMHIAGVVAGIFCGFVYIRFLQRQRRK